MSCAGPSVRRVKTNPDVNLARTLMKSQVIDAHTIFLREVILPQQYSSKPPAYMLGMHGWQRTTLQAAKLVRCSHNLSSCESHFDSLSGTTLVGGARAGASTILWTHEGHPAL